MTIIDDNNCIPKGLRVDIMRYSMENKNLLSKKGSIYVGTGETTTVGGEKIYKTRALELGSDGEVLQVKSGDLAYDKIRDVNFDSNTNYTNLVYTLNNLSLINSQFDASYSYNDLKITDRNIDDNQKSTITTNIRITRTEGECCELMQVGSAVSRRLRLKQNENGKLSLSYEGSNTGLYLHKLTLRLTWQTAQSSTIITYLSFSFMNNKSDKYTISDNDSLAIFLKALTIDQTIADATYYEGELSPCSISFENDPNPNYWYNYVFKVQADNNGRLGIQVIYLNSMVWLYTDVLLYSSSVYKITEQSEVVALLQG